MVFPQCFGSMITPILLNRRNLSTKDILTIIIWKTTRFLRLNLLKEIIALLPMKRFKKIYDITDGKAVISGAAEDSRYMREVVNDEMTKIILIIVPICLLILMLAGRTWIEPLLYISAIGVAVMLNMGTNIVFENISFITQSMSAVLQLAISMDYSLFCFIVIWKNATKALECIKHWQVPSRHRFLPFLPVPLQP